jgi:2,4-dienoyl-CoA reductase-like NADH-dependent reductase (Old Yellow Enzyme family)
MATEDSFLTERQYEYYRRIAQGGLAMIIVEAAAVNARKKAIKHMVGIYDDSFIPGLKRLVNMIHAEGVKAAQQIVDVLMAVNKVPADLTHEEIKEIIDDFVAAAIRVREAGYDAIEFHMAHMYTLADFLSQKTNTRQDEYGKDIDGRLRIIAEILGKTREKLGKDYPILCRINGDEFMVGGNTLLHTKIIAQRLQELGADAIDVSAGGRPGPEGPSSYNSFRTVPNKDWPDGVNAYLAEEIKKVVGVPVITAGKISNPDIAEEILSAGKADIIGLGRPLFCDPAFAKKAREGRAHEIIRCRYCNRCMILVWKGKPVVCVHTADKI